MLEENSVLKILKIGRQSNKYFSYSEEAKILKQLKKLQLRKIFDFLAFYHQNYQFWLSDHQPNAYILPDKNVK